VAVLLAATRAHLAAHVVPEERLLLHLLAALEHLALAHELGVDRALDAREGVHVLDLGPVAELRRAAHAHADVGVDAQAPLLHVRVARLHVLDHLLDAPQVRAGLGRRADVRLADDLDERHAGAIEVDGRVAGEAVVDRLAGVLLHVHARDADLIGVPSAVSPMTT
jgi:hypothetical protein